MKPALGMLNQGARIPTELPTTTARTLMTTAVAGVQYPKTTTAPEKIMGRKDLSEELKARALAASLRVTTSYSTWESEQRKIAWAIMIKSRPNAPVKWPVNAPKRMWRQKHVLRTVFGVSTYAFHRAHSLQLAKLLQCANKLYTIHEPMKHNSAMAGDVLLLANNYPLNQTKKLRMFKVNEIRETAIDNEEKYSVYSEVNMMFLKTFWDVIIDQEDFEVDVIFMRKNFFSAIQSCNKKKKTINKTSKRLLLHTCLSLLYFFFFFCSYERTHRVRIR